MKKFDKILICTDLDGTLLRADKSVSKENLEAIEYFKSEGGYFTFITGRMAHFARDTYDKIRPNVPVGCINGGGLFDYTSGSYVWCHEISHEVSPLIDYIEREVPEVGIQINTFGRVYFHRNNETMEWFRRITGVPNLECHYREVDEPWAKIVFGDMHEDVILRVQDLLAKHPQSEQFDFIRSEKSLYEILPKGIHKGVALEHLCEYLDMPLSRTIAVGDYNNDIGMIQAAGIGVAVANARDEVKAVADLVTVSNEEHAIAKIIDGLDRGDIKF